MPPHEGTTRLPLELEVDGALAEAMRGVERRPRAAILVMVWEDETEVGLHLPYQPEQAEEATRALVALRRGAREAFDALLKPAKRQDA